MKWWQIAGIVAIGLIAVDALASPGFEPEGDGGMRKITIWRKLESIASLTDTQRYFIMLTAYGEGGYNPAAHNDSESEVDASQRALDNNPSIRALAINCGVAPDRLATGSWGTFQRLGPYWASDMEDIFGPGHACPFVDPTLHALNLDLQIADAIHLARKLQGYNGWKAYPTVGNLRLGWANPGFMGYLSDHADRLDKYRTHAAKVRLPAGIIDEQVGLFPGNAAQIYRQLRGEA